MHHLFAKFAKYNVLTFFSLLLFFFLILPKGEMREEAAGVIEAKYLGREKEGSVLASFKILKSAGVHKEDIINQNDFKIILPKGATPQFKENEDYILFISKKGPDFSLSNLASGYHIIHGQKHAQKTLKSLAKLGDPPNGKKDVVEKQKGVQRTPASEETESKHKSNSFSQWFFSWWFLPLLSFILLRALSNVPRRKVS